jgi:hypothetical protein
MSKVLILSGWLLWRCHLSWKLAWVTECHVSLRLIFPGELWWRSWWSLLLRKLQGWDHCLCGTWGLGLCLSLKLLPEWGRQGILGCQIDHGISASMLRGWLILGLCWGLMLRPSSTWGLLARQRLLRRLLTYLPRGDILRVAPLRHVFLWR